MRALDTNVVLRLILDDDHEHAKLARQLLSEPVLISNGVLMETAWVMRSSYRQPRAIIADALAALLDIPTIHVADEPGIRWAIGRYRNDKADLADMLHIVAATGATSFASFEKRLIKQAGDKSPVPIEQLA